jgi:hypothetical protein
MQELLTERIVYPYAERIVNPWVTIRRTRVLPRAGRITRRRGDRVAGDTVIGETDAPGGYLLVEMDQALGRRGREALKVTKKKVGEPFLAGEVIASTGGIVTKEYISPVDGKIVDIHDSRVLIEVASEEVEVLALYPGEVVAVMPRAGAVIETSGTLIQGDLGIGPSLRGTLHRPVPAGDLPLLAGQITDDHRAGVLIGGRTIDAAAIDQAVETGVRGVIVGSLRSELVPAVRESGLALIASEGLGDAAMPARTFDLLSESVGREVSFAPTSEGTAQAHRPELFCYLQGSEAAEPLAGRDDRPPLIVQGAPLRRGVRVRVLRAPHLYAEGEIVSLPEVPQRLDSGLTAWGAEVDLDAVGRVFVPLENLESIR